MATIHHEILIDVPAEAVWDAARAAGPLHTRLVPGFAVNTELEADGRVRIVTFATGAVARERIVDCDDTERRLCWSIESPNVAHHNGVLQVKSAGPGHTRAVWIADVLPDSLADTFGPSMAKGLSVMKQALEARSRSRTVSA